jgi:excisionase family DNA binding protein
MSVSNGSERAAAQLLTDPGAERQLSIVLPEELVELVAERAAMLLADSRPAGPEPWLGVEEAASYLACSTSRIYTLVSARRIPYHKDGSRLLFRRSQLDAWVEAGGARRP